MELLDYSDIDLMWIDDQKDILDLSKMAVERKAEDFNVQTTSDSEELLESFETGEVDAIVSDYDMPGMTGIELLREVRKRDRNFPFFLYTGKGTEEVASEAVNEGATGYFQKEAGLDQYDLIIDSIRNSVDRYYNLERSKILTEVVEHLDRPVLVTEHDSTIIYANPAFEEVTGYEAEEIVGKNPNVLSSGYHSDQLFEEMYEALNKGEIFEIEDMRNIDKEQGQYVHDQLLIPITIHGEEPSYFAGISRLKEE